MAFLLFKRKCLLFQVKICSLNLLELPLFCNVHRSSVGLWDNFRVGLLRSCIFVPSVPRTL